MPFSTVLRTHMHSAWMSGGSIRLCFSVVVLILTFSSNAQNDGCINGLVEWISDGYCDPMNNNLNCSYDGGDCCRCDCVDSPDIPCVYSGFYCVDPASECFNELAAEYPSCNGDVTFLGDGVCSPEINNEECGYDGGDCCQCECTDDADSSCGNSNTLCVDPTSDCVSSLVVEYPNCGYLAVFGDGNCDTYNNNEECGYDGGDCCPCDCVDGTYLCENGRFFCVDPDSECIDPIASAYPSCGENLDYIIGDGLCNLANNIEECGYDGGDCCECDCVDGRDYSCSDNNGFFSCVNPASDCVDTSLALYPTCAGYLSVVGDGKCDISNNDATCGFDGGDCCQCDCSDGPNHTCGSLGFFCANPTSECVEPVVIEFPSCSYPGLLLFSGDGECLYLINNENCGYDGGDCCHCTCVGSGCPSTDELCADPNGGGLEVHNCKKAPLSVPPCTDEHPHDWVVKTTAQAYDLAETANCSNGIFNVKWIGDVTVNRTIFVLDGTVMNINGEGTKAVIDGAGNTRLFTVMSAELNIINVTLSNGSAVSGGAVATADATLRLNGTVFAGNRATVKGGALMVSNSSTVFFERTTTMVNNTAGDGGAMFILGGSSTFWTGTTTFRGNSAISGGGAVYLAESCNSSWAGVTLFSHNTVDLVRGGALCLWDNSSATWSGMTTFSQNFAPYGGAVSAWTGSRVAWMGETNFHSNHATYGGAVELQQSNITSLRAETTFLSNTAELDGGAFLLTDASSASWDLRSSTTFTGNTANVGGALAIATGSSVEWSGRTNFTANSANLDGGAVGSNSDTSPVGTFDGESRIVFRGPTSFFNNTCGANGGGVALTANISFFFKTTSVVFSGNSAGVGGGAVFISSTGESPFFNETSFTLNSAPVGGAVYASGTRTDASSGLKLEDPTSFHGCMFVGNTADITGGAVDSVSGEIGIMNSSFRSNAASVGGALRLVGTTSVVNCEFIENTSGVGGGPAVAKIGQEAYVNSSVFRDNIFRCGSGMILDTSKEGDLYDIVCSGCGPCYDCEVEDQSAVPMDCISLLDAGVKHATSSYGIVEKLNIARGYWRATNKSREIFECFNEQACKGGIAAKTSDYCMDGFKGPYCSICEDGYTQGVGFSCMKCTSKRKTVTTALITILAVLGLAAVVVIAFYLSSGEMTGSGSGFVDIVARRVPMQSVKIIIVAWQILTQVESVTKATYPGIYEPFLDLVDMITFNFTRPLLTGCFLNTNFHDHLIITIISPIVLFGLLAVTYAVGIWRHQGSDEALRNVRHKHVSMMLVITFLVYSRVSSTVFQTFACEGLDTDDPLKDKQYYLMADYSIECDHHHKKYQIIAAFMIVLYPVGIPAAYAFFLFRYRDVLQDCSEREIDLRVRATSSLWESYKPSRFYYEIVECVRRVLLTSVLLLIKGDTSAQIAVTIILAFFFAVAFEIMAPYKSHLDTWVSRLGNAVIFTSMYLSLLIKVDVSDEAEDSQHVFGAVLVTVHICMMLIVVFESVFVSYTLRAKRNRETPGPRRRSSRYQWSSTVLTAGNLRSGRSSNDPES